MNFFRNIATAAAVAAQIIFTNRYEAGVQFSKGRSYLPGFVQDARFDADSATRQEIVRKSRYFERNSALVNRLADLFEQFTVGASGLQFTPSSSDEKWNVNAKGWFDNWSQDCDLVSCADFGALQSLAVRSWFIDGEVFILLTRNDAAPMQPRIQLIEAHRVGTPGGMSPQEGKSIVDGVEIAPNGKPLAYWIRVEETDFWENKVESYRRYPVKSVIHLFEPSRPGMYRGLPLLYPVMNDLHDLDDLQILEMAANKDGAEKSTFIKSASGQLPAGKMYRQERLGVIKIDTTGTQTTQETQDYYRRTIGGRTFALRTGEDVQQFMPQRPTEATRALWDILTSKVCAGVGISKLLVYPWSVQGTVTRADLDVANVFFRARSAVAAKAFTKVYLYAVGWGVNQQRNLSDKPGDWRSVNSRPPRSVNVDVGRNSSAMLAELEAGTRTLQDIYAELGMDWREQLRQRAKEVDFINQLATEYKVHPQAITKQAVATPVAADGKTTAPLNGAQITAALDVMLKLREQALTPEAAGELMTQIGIDRDRAESMAKNIPKLDTGAGDVSFKREVLKSLLSVPAAREAVFNGMDIEDLISATGLPPEKGYEAPWIPVIAPTGPVVTGEAMKDSEGAIVGGEVENDLQAEPGDTQTTTDKEPAATA